MTTRAQLQTSVDSWLIRDDVATGPDFAQILLIAEANLALDLRCVIQEQSATVTLTGRSADLPANFSEMRNVYLDDNGRKIEYQTPQAIRESAQWVNGRSGAFYTLEGGSQTPGEERTAIVIAGPASPANPLDLEILYWARFAPLVGATDTNWLLKNFFNVYLYATLTAAAEYIQEMDLMLNYQAKYDAAKDAINKHENRKRFGVMPKQAYGNPRTVV